MNLIRSLTLLCILLYASSKTVSAQRIIHGNIADERHNPVTFATVVLQNPKDSTVIETVLTDTAGYYSFPNTGILPLLLRVAAVGYTQQDKLITDTGTRYNLTLSATRSSALKGVTVSALKPLIERKVDRTIFNVENSTATVGADALEALKKVPGVRVTNSTVSIAGKSSVNVMVNDKLVQMSGDELVAFLKSISADNLSRIEVVTTPPAKYDAAGNAGLINIVTKKQLKNGLNGNIALGVMQRTSTGGGFNGSFNYRQGKLNVYGVGNAYHALVKPDDNITTQYSGQYQRQHGDAGNTNVFNRMQVGADYSLKDNMVLGILYTIGNGGGDFYGDQFITTRLYNRNTNGLDSLIKTRASYSDRGFRNVFNLNYEWKIDTAGKKLSIDADYFTRSGKNLRAINTVNFFNEDLPTGASETSRSSGRQVVDIRSMKMDVVWPVRSVQLSFGAKMSFIHNTSNNLFEHYIDSVYRIDPLRTNEFDYRENTQALYVSAQKNMGKWSAQLGLRGEYTQTEGYSITLNQLNKNEYFKLFPTVYIQYKPNDNHAVSLNYSRRIQRPDFWSMNPFRSYYTANSYEQGNPFLQPSFSHNIEAGYLLKSKYNISVYAQFVDNITTRVSMVDSSNNSYFFTQANAGTIRNYGTNMSATFTPFKWWECSLSGNAYYSFFTSQYYGGDAFSNSRPAFSIETNNTFTLNKAKTLLAEMDVTYNSRQPSDFDIQRSFYYVFNGFKALLLNKQLTLILGFYDLFRLDRWTVENQYNGMLQDSYYDERFVRFAVTWKFGNNNIKEKRERNGDGDAGRSK